MTHSWPSNRPHRPSPRRIKASLLVGLGLAAVGYMLLAVPPDSPAEVALLRVVLGFASLFGAFALLVWPIVMGWLFPEENE